MQSFVYPCPIIQYSVSIIRKNSGHYRYPDESAYPDVLGGALTLQLESDSCQINESILASLWHLSCLIMAWKI